MTASDSLLDAVTARRDDVLADRLGATGGDAAGFDERFDIGLGELGQLFGGLLRLGGQLPGCARRRRRTAPGTCRRRAGVEAGEQLVEIISSWSWIPSICLTRRGGLAALRARLTVLAARLLTFLTASTTWPAALRLGGGAWPALVAARARLAVLAARWRPSRRSRQRPSPALAAASAAASIAFDLGFVGHVNNSSLLQCNNNAVRHAAFQEIFVHCTMKRNWRALDGRGSAEGKSGHGRADRSSIRRRRRGLLDRPVLAVRRRQVDHQPDAAGGRPAHHHVDQRDDPAEAAGRRRRTSTIISSTRPSSTRLIDAGEFAEWAYVFDHRYGTPKAPIKEALQRRPRHLVRHRLAGHAAARICDSATDLVLIFILPPSMEELERRLHERGTDSEEVIAGRMRRAAGEIGHWAEYEYVLVNEDMDKCLADVRAIIAAERLKPRAPGRSAELRPRPGRPAALSSSSSRNRARGEEVAPAARRAPPRPRRRRPIARAASARRG